MQLSIGLRMLALYAAAGASQAGSAARRPRFLQETFGSANDSPLGPLSNRHHQSRDEVSEGCVRNDRTSKIGVLREEGCELQMFIKRGCQTEVQRPLSADWPRFI